VDAARSLIAQAGAFSGRHTGELSGHAFRIGIGLNMGPAMMGNIGTNENPSFTILGDSVNVAFRLEAVSKEKGAPVIVGRSMAEWAEGCRFRDLGLVEVKGRVEPVAACALE
jgi:adenylate cyclase